MSIELAKNPLQIKQGSCTVEKISGSVADTTLAEWAKKYFMEDASVVVWRMHAVVWGTVKNGVIRFADDGALDPDTILELRIFNEEAELHAARSGKKLVGRYILDKGTQNIKYVDSLARLWGEKAGRDGEYVKLKDALRKLSLTVPCKEEASYYGLVTRNYIGHAPQNGQASYTDYRFVMITAAEGGK